MIRHGQNIEARDFKHSGKHIAFSTCSIVHISFIFAPPQGASGVIWELWGSRIAPPTILTFTRLCVAWATMGAILDESCAPLGLLLAHLGAILGHLGSMLQSPGQNL